MTLPHIHKYKIVDTTASKIFILGAHAPIRVDTKVYLLCQKCGKVSHRTFVGQEISPGDLIEIAKDKKWDYDPTLFA